MESITGTWVAATGRLPSGCSESILVNNLQLGFDDEGRILEVWGYCANTLWKQRTLSRPVYGPGSLMGKLDEVPVPGAAYRFTSSNEWPVWVDVDLGWVVLGAHDLQEPYEAVEFISDAVAIVRDGSLHAIWLRPQKLP
jgi:hypothetical protein